MLKQLRLQAELQQRRNERDALSMQEKELLRRSEELASALGEATSNDDLALVQSQLEQLEADETAAGVTEKQGKVNAEIERIEGELSEIDKRHRDAGQGGASTGQTRSNGGECTMNRYEVRDMVRSGEYYKRSEVTEFYERFKQIRAISGGDLTIPEVVINRIMDKMGDFTTLYPLVDKITVKGTVRMLFSTDTTAALWMEQTGTIPTGDVGTISAESFDGYKVGKVTFVDNAMLQDSIINLDEYVTKKLARSIALALDKAILKGEGSAAKQPDGIIPKLSAAHKVTVPDGSLVDIVKPIALIDTGDDAVSEIVAVMRRQTYYNRILRYSINVNAQGDTVGKLPNLRAPDLLGLRVVFSNHMDNNQILYGDFLKYTLVERESMAIDRSEHVKFSEDQMGFRGKGRYDGKPTDKDAFVLVTIEDAAVGG